MLFPYANAKILYHILLKGGIIFLNSLGIIAEYNPFHNGHLYHLEQAKKLSAKNFSIAIMSGNFTQRGTPAIFDKWTRAAIAVKSGIDLVIELPFAFSVRSAQDFASGGVRLLNSLGIVTDLCFGTENANKQLLQQIATITNDPNTILLLKQYMKSGHSYATALSLAVKETANLPEYLLNQPNNILAIEYLKALTKYHATLNPILIERKTAQYHDPTIVSSIASATAIRNELIDKTPNLDALRNSIPDPCSQVILKSIEEQTSFPDISYLDAAVLSLLRKARPTELIKILTVSEGLENKLPAAALTSNTIATLLQTVKSKRYPLSRLQRTLIHCLLGSSKELFRDFDAAGPLYARVLAFNDNGRLLLKELKTASKIPIIIKATDYLTTTARNQEDMTLLQQMLTFDTYATDLYTLCYKEKKVGALDFTKSPTYVRS